jgi:hypothetical protein
MCSRPTNAPDTLAKMTLHDGARRGGECVAGDHRCSPYACKNKRVAVSQCPPFVDPWRCGPVALQGQSDKNLQSIANPNFGLRPAVDVKSLHAKIGELTLENDFLEGALGKAGLLSAKR